MIPLLDADTKNSVGLTHPIEEISHNALAVYWNPFESAAKVRYLVQFNPIWDNFIQFGPILLNLVQFGQILEAN